MTPRACRLDTTHHDIVDTLLAHGYRCQSLAQVGMGCPDALVSKGGQMWLLEFKSKGGKLTDFQKRWIETWDAPVHVVTTPEEALEAVTR